MKQSIFKKAPRFAAITILAVTAGTMSLQPLGVLGSSHREAPLISGDPKADGTDLYAFVSPDKPDSATLIANYLPFQNPSGGPNFYSFDDNVKYDINIDNNGDALPDITYSYVFKTTTANPKTFLYNTGPIKSLDDPNWNVKQTYTLTKTVQGVPTVLGDNIPTPPSNVGPKSTPDYAGLQTAAVKDLGNGVTSFAGQSDDPFYADLGGIFDLLTIRKLPGNAGAGADSLKGFSVQSLALQVPIADLTSSSTKPTDPKDPTAVVGLWTTASRKATTVLNGNGTTSSDGNYVQVSRLGAPLVNEVVVPLGAKDLWNSSVPSGDAQFANGVTNPELGKLLNSIYKIKVPPQGNFGTPEARDDLVAIYLTGLKDLTMPANVVPSEQLRVNLAVPSTKNPNRLGVLAKDNQGFPNGRRLADDVVDISEQAVAGAAYPLFHPDFKADPLATKLGDGVNKNDKPFRSTFPYLALPDDGINAKLTSSVTASSNKNDTKNTSSSSALVVGLAALVIGALLGGLVIKKR